MGEVPTFDRSKSLDNTPPRKSPSKSDPSVRNLSQDERDIIEFIKKENLIKSDSDLMQFMESEKYKEIIGDMEGHGEDGPNEEEVDESSGETGQALSKHLLLRILYNIRESTKEQIRKVKQS